MEQRSLYPRWLRTLVDPERLERDANGEVIIVEKRDEDGGVTKRTPKRKPNPASYNGQSGQLTQLRAADSRDATQLKTSIEAELRDEGRDEADIAETIALLDIGTEWASMPIEVMRSPLKRVNHAFKAFFRRVASGETPGYPRFRSARRYDSLDIGHVTVKGNRIHVPKLGHVKMNLYRPLEGEIKAAVIRRDATGKWWASFSCDVGDAHAKIPAESVPDERTVGIDLGLTDLVTLSTGKEIPNPRFARHAAEQLARAQRELARKKKGSNNRKRATTLVAKAYAHVANQRLDFARKLTSDLYKRFDAVFYEDLNLVGLCRGLFSKSFADAAWGLIVRCLVSKAEEAGKHEASVDARMTSQLCARCHTLVTKELCERVHHCHHCGLNIGRDHNAALVVQGRGLDAFRGRRESTTEKPPRFARIWRGKAQGVPSRHG